MEKGSRVWYGIKITEVVLVCASIACVVAAHQYVDVLDDFSNCDKVKLSSFLIVYPCCIVVFITLVMELFGTRFKDPIRKCPTLVFIFICILAGMTAFSIAVINSLNNQFILMIIASVCWALFLVLALADFVFVIFS